jgi:hypothetical protein
MKIKISFNSYEVEATLLDTPTGKAVYDSLPIKSTVNTWGDEIYFGISVDVEPEAQAKAETEIGDLAFWPPMPAFCIFFGPTPASIDDTPTAANPVNVFGKLNPIDVDNLRSIQDGERVIVEKMG